MTRSTNLSIEFPGGTVVKATVRTSRKKNSNADKLMRDESELQHDEIVDSVVEAIRSPHYERKAPLRTVKIK